jgi:trimeric autotransporter adhesin
VKWNGVDFEPFGEGLSGPGRTVCKYDAGDEGVIYVGGSFVQAGGQPAYYVATWDSEEWNRIGTAEGLGAVNPILSIATFDSGTGDELYVSGPNQTTIGGLEGEHALVRWDGETWSIVSDEWSGTAIAMEMLDVGNGPALYLGGAFALFLDSDPYFGRVAKWDGRSFTPLGQGLNQQVNDFAVYDDGNGEALYAGGSFTQTGDGVSANRIARWDGKSWHPLGSGLGGISQGSVWAIEPFDDGSGPALYAAGRFNTAGGVPAINVARWDGTAWTAVGDGLNDLVRALKVFDDGTGPALYAAGHFTASGSKPMNHIAKWNGTQWS